MESLGVKLRTVREARSLTFEQVSRDTNIAVRYLEFLETENFAGFPGEAYILGFLRNYGAYLDIDVQELLFLYRAIRIQEQPVPVEQLLRGPSKLPKILITIAVILVVLGAGGGIAWFVITRPPQTKAAAPAGRSPAEHTLSADWAERRFFRGDSVLVPLETIQYKLELANLGEVATVRGPGGTVILDLGQEAAMDLNSDGIADLRVMAVDFAKNNPDMGVLLRFELSDLPVLSDAAAETGEGAGLETISVANLVNAALIFSSPNPYPFTLQANFQGYCMLRWEILFERDRRDRKEEYFPQGAELSIQAQNGIRLWASNAQAAKCQIIGGGRTVPLELGAAGEVVVTDIRWVRDEDGRYRLVLARLEQ